MILDKAKEIIEKFYEQAECGIYNSRNLVGDPMVNIYNDGTLSIDVCFHYGYFEVFGLSETEFSELANFYSSLAERK